LAIYILSSDMQVLMALILVEVLGLLLGWGTFDHAAHLGGALFGM